MLGQFPLDPLVDIHLSHCLTFVDRFARAGYFRLTARATCRFCFKVPYCDTRARAFRAWLKSGIGYLPGDPFVGLIAKVVGFNRLRFLIVAIYPSACMTL